MSRLTISSPDIAAPGSTQGVLMRHILSTVERVAVSDLSVRIVGENGSGKEWLARLIHRMSARADHEFVHLDCSTIPFHTVQQEIFGSETIGLSRREIRPGLLETASEGTVYFDKVSTLPLSVREKLILAFERQHFRRVGGSTEVHCNVRAIEGMNMPPDEAHLRDAAGRRASLRIGQVCINMPPLRERRDEIPYLIGACIEEFRMRTRSGTEGMTPEALALCAAYDWPGNIQELRNAIEYASLLSGRGPIDREHLPPALRRHKAENGERAHDAPLNLSA